MNKHDRLTRKLRDALDEDKTLQGDLGIQEVEEVLLFLLEEFADHSRFLLPKETETSREDKSNPEHQAVFDGEVNQDRVHDHDETDDSWEAGGPLEGLAEGEDTDVARSETQSEARESDHPVDGLALLPDEQREEPMDLGEGTKKGKRGKNV